MAGHDDDSARQRDRPAADDPQRARGHEIWRLVPVLCRASFGVRGANIPAILRALVACGWFGIQTWIGALALNTLLIAAWPAWAGIAAGIWISFAIFWAIQVWIIVNGLEGHQETRGMVGAASARRRRAAARMGHRPRRRPRSHPQRIGAAAADARARSGGSSRPRLPRTSATGRHSASTFRTSRATREASDPRRSGRRSACRRR